jgi:hypothetical protein
MENLEEGIKYPTEEVQGEAVRALAELVRNYFPKPSEALQKRLVRKFMVYVGPGEKREGEERREEGGDGQVKEEGEDIEKGGRKEGEWRKKGGEEGGGGKREEGGGRREEGVRMEEGGRRKGGKRCGGG